MTGISLPDLPRAACRGHATLFDPQNDGEPDVHAHTRWVRAVEICDGCPELAPCATWVDQVPEKSRHGVIAGRFHK
ncbi:hypothetical protein AWB98_06660 [Mycolicibacterium conceptionense]|uniref:4Fe-4S Wbl-type domain-containing protein n=1 Tax=Mycolicibacterium conceptionense TaxID=451644 RepID=A0ABX3VCE8_9MYCO|nr:hypothetical protein AWB98_06660 [Mycolicibacterium conceptionense]